MKKRVWLYLKPDDVKFLNNVGYLIGCTTRHKQIEFVIKTFRLLIPDPTLTPFVISELLGDISILARSIRKGPTERAWVYLSEDDLTYVDVFGAQMGERARSKTIVYLIRLFRLILPNVAEVSKLVRKMLES